MSDTMMLMCFLPFLKSLKMYTFSFSFTVGQLNFVVLLCLTLTPWSLTLFFQCSFAVRQLNEVNYADIDTPSTWYVIINECLISL